MKFRLMVLIAALLLTAQGVITAQETTVEVPLFASVQDGVLLVASSGEEPQEVYSAIGFNYLAWNAEGTRLAFIQHDENFERMLGVYDSESGEVTLLETSNLTAGFNFSWMDDGRILFSAESEENDPVNNPVFKADILAIEPSAEAQPELLGTIEYGVGCGGGSSIPADWVYGEETSGFMGNSLTLVETPYGILTSLNCGGTGVGLLDTGTDELTVVTEDLSRVVVSPDGTHAAGIEINYEDPTASRLFVYDLETLAISEIETPVAPDLVVWSADSLNLYYSARTLTANLVEELSADEQTVLNDALGYEVAEMPAFTSEIYQVAAAGGESILLVSDDAYAIGRITATPSALYYTSISNVGDWLQGVITGEVNPTDVQKAPPFIDEEVFQLVEGEAPTLLGGYHQFTPVTAE